MPRYLEITDGTTSFRLDGSNATDFFAVKSKQWAPAISRRSNDSFSGELYLPVTETMPLVVQSTDETAVMANVETLNGLIEQAGQWYKNEDVPAVLLRFSPTSDTDYWEVPITGPPDYGQAVTLPANFEEYLAMGRVTGLLLSFKRKGQWLGEEESDIGDYVNNPGLMITSLTATQNKSPQSFYIENFIRPVSKGAYLIFSEDADKIDIMTASTMTATGFTAVNDAAKWPYSGTNVLRYTPADTAWKETGIINVESNLLSDTKDMEIFVNIRRNSSGTNCLIRASMSSDSASSKPAVLTTPIAITEVGEQWYRLGSIKLIHTLGYGTPDYNLSLLLKTDNTSSTVDIDAIVIADARDLRVIFMPGSAASTSISTLRLMYRSTTHPLPKIASVGGEVAEPYFGNAMIHTSEAEQAVIWLDTNPGTSWCHTQSLLSRTQTKLTSFRRPGYLIPQ